MLSKLFSSIATAVGRATGNPLAFILACAMVVIWAVSGPVFHYSDTWQLVINTGTTVVTFLLLFVVQNTQNRDSQAVHIKLDEILRALPEARTAMALADLENATEKLLGQQRAETLRLAQGEEKDE